MRRQEADDGALCIECGRPATHERLEGMAWDIEVVELVCEDHEVSS